MDLWELESGCIVHLTNGSRIRDATHIYGTWVLWHGAWYLASDKLTPINLLGYRQHLHTRVYLADSRLTVEPRSMIPSDSSLVFFLSFFLVPITVHIWKCVVASSTCLAME